MEKTILANKLFGSILIDQFCGLFKPAREIVSTNLFFKLDYTIDLKHEYFKILMYLFAGILIACLLAIITWTIVPKNYKSNKTSTYECGFQSFGSAKFNFDVQFFIVAILFVIFDVEIIFMYPWAKSLVFTGFWGFFIMLIFIIILGVGFAYEWQKGVLTWKPLYGKKPV